MAQRGATASLTLTLGAALATCVVVAAILGGPAILDCSRDSGSIGACLRDKIDDSGFFGRKAPATVVTTAKAPIVPPAPRPRPAGWIEANATEYVPPPPAVAILSGDEGRLDATGLVQVAPSPDAQAALAEPQGRLGATGGSGAAGADGVVALNEPTGALIGTGSAPAPDRPDAQVALAPPAGTLSAGGDLVATATPNVAIGLKPPTGIVTAKGSGPAPAAEAFVALTQEPGKLEASGLLPPPDTTAGSILRAPRGKLSASMVPLEANAPFVAELTVNAGSVEALGATAATSASALAVPSRQPELTTITGDIGPQTSTDALVTLDPASPSDAFTAVGGELGTPPPIQPSVALVGRPAVPAPEESTAAAPDPKPSTRPSRILQNNPAYPDVMVLPAPNTGEHSSFGTLQLH